MHKIKRTLLIAFLGLISISNSIAQNDECTIKLKSGKTLNGLCRLISKNRIKFRDDAAAKSAKYDFRICESVNISSNGISRKYIQLPVLGRDHSIVVEEKIVGKISLYTITNGGRAPMAGSFGVAGGMAPGVGVYYSRENYYIKRSDTDSLVHLGSNELFSGKFRNSASVYFKDCPDLSSNIKNKSEGFGKNDIETIIEFYNEKCN